VVDGSKELVARYYVVSEGKEYHTGMLKVEVLTADPE
jgi:hypothetical protein